MSLIVTREQIKAAKERQRREGRVRHEIKSPDGYVDSVTALQQEAARVAALLRK